MATHSLVDSSLASFTPQSHPFHDHRRLARQKSKERRLIILACSHSFHSRAVVLSIAHAIMPASANQQLDLPCNLCILIYRPGQSFCAILVDGSPTLQWLARSEIEEAPPSTITNFSPPPFMLTIAESRLRPWSYLSPLRIFRRRRREGTWNTRWKLNHCWHISVTTYGWLQWLQTREVGNITSRGGSAAVLIWQPTSLLLCVCRWGFGFRNHSSWLATT